MRAFLAVEVGDETRRAAARASRVLQQSVRARGVRWARPESYHITLHFLGEIEPERRPDLAREVGGRVRGCAPFSLHPTAALAFPSARRPRVIAVEVAPRAPLEALARQVEAGVVASGLPAAERPFRPHLTLGRLRDRTHPDLTGADVEPVPFRVDEVVLFESALRPGGAVHTPLERMPLEGPDSQATQTPEGEEAHGQERPLH